MVLGFDCGGNTGWGVINEKDNKLIEWGLVKGSGKNIIEYLEEIKSVYRKHLPDIVVIEEPFINVKKPTAVIPLVKFIQTVVIGVLEENRDALILFVSNKTVKKWVGGNGNCKKETVYNKVVKGFKLEGFNYEEYNDVTDAIALSLVGCKVLRKEIIL